MRSTLSRTARIFPPIRQLIASRDAALLERNDARASALAERDAALAERDAALAERDAALAERDAAYAATLRRVLDLASLDTYLRASLNGCPLWLPRDTLLTMTHCAHWEPDGGLLLWVENAHLTWMTERLAAGGTFLDVGASTGATTLPIAVKGSVTIVSYEPATAARELLAATLTRNGIGGVTIRPVAVSDELGEVEFREYQPDATGGTPYQPEASSLAAPIMSAAQHRTYRVPVVTLDGDALSHCTEPAVIKIDVEGFEVHVLRGARRLIKERRPYLSIDIHTDPFGDGTTTTEANVVGLLPDYRCERLGHVLVCTPLAPIPS